MAWEGATKKGLAVSFLFGLVRISPHGGARIRFLIDLKPSSAMYFWALVSKYRRTGRGEYDLRGTCTAPDRITCIVETGIRDRGFRGQ